MYFVYILHSAKFDKYYIGSTEDPERRISEHNTSPFNTYTSKYRPWTLAATFPLGETRDIAVRYERKLKSMKSRIIIKDLIAHDSDVGYFTQLVRVPTSRD
jgi:putative endonuclease